MTDHKNPQTLDVNEALNKSEAFVVTHKKTLITCIAAVIVIIAGILLYHNFIVTPQNEKASTMLAKGQMYFANNDFNKALSGDSIGYIGFVKIINEYSGTDAANLAKLYAGLSYAQQNKIHEAIKYLEDYSPADDDMVSPAAIGTLGNCYAKAGQLDKAVETLKKAAQMADNNSLSPTFLLEAGQILESQKKNKEAVTLYQEIKDKYYESLPAQDIDKYIERASAQ